MPKDYYNLLGRFQRSEARTRLSKVNGSVISISNELPGPACRRILKKGLPRHVLPNQLLDDVTEKLKAQNLT